MVLPSRLHEKIKPSLRLTTDTATRTRRKIARQRSCPNQDSCSGKIVAVRFRAWCSRMIREKAALSSVKGLLLERMNSRFATSEDIA